MKNHDKIIDKIKKCLALSSSSNEHEAAAALRQAHSLMNKYRIEESAILASEAGEEIARSVARRYPQKYEISLAQNVASHFGCKLLFGSANWKFIGCGAAPEIASYAFQALIRQLKRARTYYIDTELIGCKQTTKTRRANNFCEGWVMAITRNVREFAGTEQQSAAIDSFIKKNYPVVRPNSGYAARHSKLNHAAYRDMARGAYFAADVNLNHSIHR